MSATPLTADEALAIFREHDPTGRYTKNLKGTAVAVWDGTRWQVIAASLITGGWALMDPRVLVDGEDPFPQDRWIPVP